MSQFTIYKSGDASAPSITNVAGTLWKALYAILVYGYGSKSAAGWTVYGASCDGTYSGATPTSTRGGFINASSASPTGSGTGFYIDVDDTADVPTAAGRTLFSVQPRF
jgi:hypothetical protein